MSFSTVDFHAPSNPKLPLKPNTSTAATHEMCDKGDAAQAAPSAAGSVISPGKKKQRKKTRKWDRRIRKEESVHVLVSAFLNSTDRLNIYTLTQNSFYTEHFKEGAEKQRGNAGRL